MKLSNTGPVLRLLLPLLLCLQCAADAWAFDRRGLECSALSPTPAVRREIAHGRGLLFQVEAAPVPASFIFATIHLADERVTTLPAPVRQAFDGAQGFVMEALFDPVGIAELSLLMMYTAGTQLEQQLGGKWFAPTAQLLAVHGVPPTMASLLKPWAAYLTLSMPIQHGELPLDFRLMQDAQQRGLTVAGLETVAEQAAALGSLTLADQIALLKSAICHYETVQANVEESLLAYLDRDLAILAAGSQRYSAENEQLHRRLLDSLVIKRNLRMVERMLPRLREGKVFVAVGALHLPGRQGILRLLEQRGYVVTVRY